MSLLLLKKYLSCIRASLPFMVGVLFYIYTISSAQAAICFLPDCGDKDTIPESNQDAEKCKDEGYESFQNRVCHQYSIVEFCPYNSNYIKCNNKKWCELNGYIETVCEEPYELFNKCPNGEEMYKECKLNMEEACMAEDPTYVSTCDAGWVIDPNDHCSYSDEFGHCCNTCPGFISKEELGDKTAVASCNSCDGTKYIAADDGFNACKGFWDCQDGCEIGSETCVSFGVTKCKVCKRCEARCDLEECPYGADCEYENCTQRYCVLGCAVGYTNYCEAPSSTDCNVLGYTQNPSDCGASTMIECPFDDNQVMCIEDDGSCCVPCASFPETSIPNGYIATETCTCCGKKQYKIAINPCNGYQECQYGGAENSLSCQSGDIIKYNICKECPNACPENSSCPTGAVCQFDSCSGSYCPTGCKTGYTNYCSMPNTDCRSLGYYLANNCWITNTVKCPYNTNYVFCY